MNILKNLFSFNKKSVKNQDFNTIFVDQYIEIAKLVKEARIQQNLSIKELSYISKIPERIINSIENNNKNIRPEYPFIRSILIKLEECLALKKNTLLKLAVRERKISKKAEKDFLFRKVDLIKGYCGLIFLLLSSIEFIIRSGIFEMYDNSLIVRFCCILASFTNFAISIYWSTNPELKSLFFSDFLLSKKRFFKIFIQFPKINNTFYLLFLKYHIHF